MNTRHPSDPFEHLIDHALRDLPLQSAPTDLQANVFAEIQRRAALPWWRRPFAQWPMSIRMVFLVLCLGLANFSVALLRWLSTEPRSVELSDVLSRPVTWLERVDGLMLGTQDFLALLLRHLPAPLLYGALFTVALLYVALFGIGAAAYRTLYVNR